jgi:hypothetical protein
MSAKGFFSAQEGHWVPLIGPIDITGGKTSPPVALKVWNHASILLAIGVSAAAFIKIIVNACTDAAGDSATAIPFKLYAAETASLDQLGPLVAVPAAGYTPSANDNIYYVIELDTDDLIAVGPTFSYFQLQLTNGANSVIAFAGAVLSKGRYAGDQTPSVLT